MKTKPTPAMVGEAIGIYAQNVADSTTDAVLASVNAQLAAVLPARDAQVAANARAALLAELAEAGRLRSRTTPVYRKVVRDVSGAIEGVIEMPVEDSNSVE